MLAASGDLRGALRGGMIGNMMRREGWRWPRSVSWRSVSWRSVSWRSVSSGPVHSYAYEDLGKEALSDAIKTVPLAFDKHSPPGYLSALNAPIVFLHGLFGSKANNRTVSKKLARLLDRDVYCLDLRNHGDSPHDERMDYPAMAADVEQFIADHELEHPIVMGHSMGAKAAMGLCLRKPKLASALIPVDNAPVDYTAGGSGFSTFGIYIRALQQIERTPGLKSLKECDEILAKVEKNQTIRQFLLTNIKKRPDGEDGYYCRVPLEIIRKNLDKISGWPFSYNLCRYTGPVDIIRGTESAYVADEYLGQIGLYFPKFQVDDVEAGHWLISQQPEAFIGDVAQFVEYEEDY